MARASVCWIICVFVTLSDALSPYSDGFYYRKTLNFFRRGGNEECSVCFGNDCLVMDQARCEFYTKTSELVNANHDNEDAQETNQSSVQIRREVDTLMMDLIEQVSATQMFKECIPLISKYTDCTKENTWLGCTTCSCDEEGRWNCSTTQRCQPASPMNVDHQTLVVVMEALSNKEISSMRSKRSVTIEDAVTKKSKITYEDLSEWMYGVKPLYSEDPVKSTDNSKTDMAAMIAENAEAMTTDVSTPNHIAKSKPESDYLAFDDVLNNIGIEDKSYNRRKQLNIYQHIQDQDYINLDDNNATFNKYNNFNFSENFFDVLNAIEGMNDEDFIKSKASGTTEVVIDLLDVARNNIGTDAIFTASNNTDFEDMFDDTRNSLTNTSFENLNDVIDYNVINLRKRDILQVVHDYNSSFTSTSTTKPTTVQINNTAIDNIQRHDVFTALNKIILAKEKELQELLNMKEKLLKFIKTASNETIYIHVNNTPLWTNITNAHFSFYNVEILPSLCHGYKRSDTKNIDKHLERLRHDILIVIRDIVGIQKVIGKNNFPSDLKMLIRSMKQFIYNNANLQREFENKVTGNNFRRYLENPHSLNKYLVQKYLIDILQVIDKNMPQSYALNFLSPKCKEIIKRVINNYNSVDDSKSSYKIIDLEYQLTNDLKNIGDKWQKVTACIFDTSPESKMYCMKLLHLVLLSDIDKMTDTLALMNFASNRRLITIHDELSEKELKRINSDLKSIHTKINRILEFKTILRNQPKSEVKKVNSKAKSTKKETLLKHIRNLLRSSKKDIIKLLRKKIPKTEIVKELARKKLDELTKKKLIEYESIMQNWQKNLNVNRRKRSLFNIENIKTRIKNILPKYLRGKVHSGIKKSTKSKKKHPLMSHRSKNQRKRNNVKHKISTTTVKTITTLSNKSKV